MREIQYSIEIETSRENVWKTLWDDASFRDWASFIDEGTYMQGMMKEGSEVQFISSINGYGVTSFIEKLTVNEYVLFLHQADTMDSGQDSREKEWTGGKEGYHLKEKDAKIELVIIMDVPLHQEETFNERVPRALNRIKELAEENR